MLYHKRPTKDPRGASDEGAPLVFIKNKFFKMCNNLGKNGLKSLNKV